MKPTRLPALVVIVAALSIAGCGSGSSNTGSSSANSGSTGSTGTVTTGASTTSNVSSTSGTPLSSSQLVSKADAICKRLNAEIDSKKNSVSTPSDVVRVAAQRAALEQTALSELNELKPPSSGAVAHYYQQILVARQALIEDTKKLGEYAASGQTQAESPVYASSAAVVEQMAVMAKQGGFKHCGQLG